MTAYASSILKKGIAQGKTEGGNAMIYSLVSEGDLSIEKGARKLNISVEQLLNNMALAGYQLPNT